jgi:hypothetical protein
MKRVPLIFVAVVTGSLLMNCTGVTSPEIGGSRDTRTGPVYFMPTTRITLTVTVDEKKKQLILAAAQPTYIADEKHRYRLNSIYSPFHAETADFSIQNGLLTSVELESEGRLGAIVVAAAKSAFLIAESATTAPDQKIYHSAPIDVAKMVPAPGSTARSNELDRLNYEINKAVCGHINHYDSFLDDPINNVTDADCLRYESSFEVFLSRSTGGGGNAPIDISVNRTFPDAPTAMAEGSDPSIAEDCSVGFCYRIPVGYRLRADFFDHTTRIVEFEVPNGSPIYAAAVNRGVFTKWHTTATLANGVLQTYKILTDKSELEALVGLPADIVGAQIAALTQQGALFNARSTLIDKEIKLIETRERLRKERETEVAESAASGSGNPLFEFRAGAADPQEGGAGLIVGPGGEDGNAPPSDGVFAPID